MLTMTRGPYARDFTVDESKTPAWFASDSARRLALAVLSFQAPNGGWSKHVDFSQHDRRPGESFFTESADWEWISTIDNGATTEEIRFLARVDAAKPSDRYRRNIVRDRLSHWVAIPEWMLPAGVSTAGQLSRRRDVQRRRDRSCAQPSARRGQQQIPICAASISGDGRAAAAIDRGVDCILAAQVRVNGKLTAWGQQHDPLTLEPRAREATATSLSAQESASILDFLMSLPTPNETGRSIGSRRRGVARAAPDSGLHLLQVRVQAGHPRFRSGAGSTRSDPTE